MRRYLLPLLAALLAAAASAAFALADYGDDDRSGPAQYAIGFWGDVPYSDEQEISGVPNLIEDMNRQRLAFSAHVGDIKAGGALCDDEVYTQFKGFLDSLEAPALYTPGDNEWTDCDRPAAGGFDSEERLEHLRSVLFADPSLSLGQRRLALEHQAAPYVENAYWEKGGVSYATLHVVGSENNLGDVAPDPPENEARDKATNEWLRASFDKARSTGSAGLLLVTQANPGFDLSDPTRAPVRDPKTLQDPEAPDGFVNFLSALREETISFGKPVVLVHGDSHYFRIDKPLQDSQGRRLENFTRLETPGDNAQNGNNDVHWVKVQVDPASREVFSFQPQIVPQNRPAVPAPIADATKGTLRFATFNGSVNRNAEGQLLEELSNGDDPQLRNVAEIIQRTRPHVLLVNEFDFVPDQRAARLFQRNYLSVSQHGARPIEFPYRFVAPSNTGIASGKDFDNDGQIVTEPGSGVYGNDAFGFGEFAGKFGMAVFSRLPIDSQRARTFQRFRWKDMPGARLPDDPATPAPNDWYSPDELDVFRLSSKSHWDLPIEVGHGERVHFLVSHPTPPVFDGPEDRNGTRNADEIRFWSDYVTPGAGGYMYDDRGRRGGLAKGERFVIAGDQNADPFDGDGLPGAVRQLLDNPRINARATPSSPGGPEQAALQGQANATHKGPPANDTADFADGAPGNLRADYVLPDSRTRIANSFVFWPRSTDPLFGLVGLFDTKLLPDGNGFPSSDHRLVAVDIELER